MKNIIKYQLLDRWQTYKIAAGIMVLLNLAAMMLILLLPANGTHGAALTGGLWVSLGYLSASIIPIVAFFAASCGHIDELLYKNTGYLTLSLPRTGAEILGGRMIAGLIEFLAYALPAFLFMYLNTTILAFKTDSGLLRNGQLFINFNIIELLKVGGLCIVYFAIIGSFISFAAILSASIIKRRRLASVLSIIAAVFLLGQISNFGDWLYRKFNFLGTIPIGRDIIRITNTENIMQMTDIAVPVAPIVLLFIAAALLFFVSSALLEKKFEV